MAILFFPLISTDCFSLISYFKLIGAVSVHLHVLLPQSRNLIRGAICLSGSAFLRYTYLDERNHFKKMLAFAQKTNNTISHLHELIDFLKQVPAPAIVNGVSQMLVNRTLILDWAPVLESAC